MSTMSAYLVLGLVVLGVGAAVTVGSVLPRSSYEFGIIQTSDNGYVLVSTPVIWLGKMTIRYSVTNLEPVDLFVLTESQFRSYSNGLIHPYVYFETGVAGEVAVRLHDVGKYYVVFERGNSAIGDPTVSVTCVVRGVTVLQALAGTGIVLAGVALMGLAWKERGNRGVNQLWSRPSDLANACGWNFPKWPGRDR